MIYVSIDIAKLNHFVSALSSDGKELKKLFKFKNVGDDIQMLLALRSFPAATTASSCILNPRHITTVTLSDTLLPVTTMYVLSPIKDI